MQKEFYIVQVGFEGGGFEYEVRKGVGVNSILIIKRNTLEEARETIKMIKGKKEISRRVVE